MKRRTIAFAALVAAGLALVGCATPTGDAIPGTAAGVAPVPGPPDGPVTAQGTVMDIGGSVELCLGGVAESYPPQCSGVPLEGWSWDGVEGSESSGDTTWGAYALQGEYDGTTFTVTEAPIMLALYDPMPLPDPTDGATGAADEATLTEIQDSLPQWLGNDGSAFLSSYPERGYLWVDVVWDDGSIQDAADAEYGVDTVVIRSAIREIG